MTTLLKDDGAGFSKDALKKAVTDETINATRSVELNEMAQQVAEQFAAGSISPNIIAGIVRLMEFLGIASVGLIAYFMADLHGSTLQYWYIGAAFVAAFLYIGIQQGLDGYHPHALRGYLVQMAKSSAALGVSFTLIFLASMIFGLQGEFSTTWLSSAFAGAIGFVLLARLTTVHSVRKLSAAGRLERRAVIVGGGQMAADLINSLEAQENSDIRICGIFDDRDGDRSPPVVAGYPKLGTVQELVEFARKARISMLIVALPLSAENRVLQMLKHLWVLPVDIRLSAHADKLRFRPRTMSYEGSVPMLDVFEKPIADWDSVLKRAFDLFFASIAIVVLSPLMIAAAIAVKLDSEGPVFFKQKRHGFNNEEINVFKFRSLHHKQADKECKTAVTKGDSRVTRVGRIIRKTSIDELPQLFNVLMGSLSLVGPRPHVVNAQTDDKLWSDVVESYIARHKVKPGVTGWAQINGWRGEVDSEEKLRERTNHDLYYIENWSVLFDLYILAITPFKILNTENAY